MPDIEISVNEVAKLLSNLNSAKVSDPDAIRLEGAESGNRTNSYCYFREVSGYR